MENIKQKRKKNRGFILMTTYLLISVFSIFSLALFSRGTVFVQTTERSKHRMVAFNMAEAGVDFALAQIAQDSSYGIGQTLPYVNMSTNTVSGGYQIAITDPSPSVRQITVSGFAPSNNIAQRGFAKRDITTYLQTGGAPFTMFEYAVFGANQVKINGSIWSDSYNSNNNNGAYHFSYTTGNGTIATNGSTTNSIDFFGSGSIYGDLIAGPGSNLSTAISVEGSLAFGPGNSMMAAAEAKNYQPATTNVISVGALEVNSHTGTAEGDTALTSACLSTGFKTCTLQAGQTYHFDSLKLKDGASLDFSGTGQTKIYVDGKLEIKDSSVSTPGNRAPNLLFMSSGDKVSLTPTSALYAGIYAPNAKIETKGSATVYGALIGDKYDLDGSTTIHFDEALRDEQGSSGSGSGNQMLSWRDGTTAAWGVGPKATSTTTNGGSIEETVPTGTASR
jgi:Tfp pilus assembly protein PilX